MLKFLETLQPKKHIVLTILNYSKSKFPIAILGPCSNVTTWITDTFHWLYPVVWVRMFYSTFSRTTPVKCLNLCQCVWVYVCKAPEPKYTFGPRGEEKNTHLLCTNAWLLDFSRSLWNFPPIQHLKNEAIRNRQMNSCTCFPARAVATSSVSSYSTQNCMQSAKKKGQDWQQSRSSSLPLKHSARWGTHRRCRGVWRRRPSCSKAVPALFLD